MISSEPPKVVSAALYNYKEACALLGIHRNTLRQYVEKNWIHPKADMYTGRNLFEGKELTRFWFSRVH